MNNMNNTAQHLLAMHRAMRRIRRIEEILAATYKKQLIRTPAHFGIGQEAVAVGICQALETKDVVYSHHRCHTHYLAKGGDPYRMVAELLGREDGCSRGRGGSVHLTDRSVGVVATAAILGQTIPVAVGSALAFKMDRTPQVSVVFFGDAALEEGVFFESANYAAINKLPVLFICEDNHYSAETARDIRIPPGTSHLDRARASGITGRHVDGNDVAAVYEAATTAVEQCRAGDGPYFLECETYRWLEHVGPLFDQEAGRIYRSPDEVADWMEKDPLIQSRRTLTEIHGADEQDLDAWDARLEEELDDIFKRALAAPWPKQDSLLENTY